MTRERVAKIPSEPFPGVEDDHYFGVASSFHLHGSLELKQFLVIGVVVEPQRDVHDPYL